ncbi:MAG: prolyl oligopeptidase family serine peptidase [Bacteroidota bacterium]
MRNYATILIVNLMSILSSFGQTLNKSLDTAAFDKWGYVSEPSITNDGKYVGYISQYGGSKHRTLTIKTVTGNWTKKFGPNISRYSFLGDSKRVLILNQENLLQWIDLGTSRISKTYKAPSFQVFKQNNTEWLVINSPENTITIINYRTEKETKYRNVKTYFQDKDKNLLVLVNEDDALSVVTLCNMEQKVIGTFKGIKNITLDNNGGKMAFMMNTAIWMYNIKAGTLEQLISDKSSDVDTSLFVTGISRFSEVGNRLFIYLTEKAVAPEIEPQAVKVKVWNYKDSRLRTDPGKIFTAQTFLFSIDLNDKKIIRIQRHFENVRFLNDHNTDLISIEYVKGADYEKHWNKKAQPLYFIYDYWTNKRYSVNFQPRGLSPDGKYVIGVDSLRVNYRVWNSNTHNEYDLTEHLEIISDQHGVVLEDLKFWRFAGWCDKHSLLLYDENDIWELDVANPTKHKNLTHGLGKRENLRFTFSESPSDDIFNSNDALLLYAFNNDNKQNGFYKLSFDPTKEPKKLIMSNALYGFPANPMLSGFRPIKAKHENIWLINKERVDSCPNFFVTKNFNVFTQVSDMYPEKEYNWLTSELINFTTLDGKPSQAILYKPTIIDPNKRYPVVINYYEKQSDQLHAYLRPNAPSDNLNVPWLVSQGYIVCKPDIIYTQMKAGESAVASVEGVAKYLAKLPYIDSANVGLNGHSWGGYLTNYIVTHSNYFKAAISSSGVSNLVNATNSLTLEGINFFDMSTFYRHERFGETIWDRPDLFIGNSPVLDIPRITTPLLLMANENDGIVNVEQGIQFFYGLRRLGKPAWLLQYKDEFHSLFKEKNMLDYGSKTLDFLDHYLKGKSMPKWMNEAK